MEAKQEQEEFNKAYEAAMNDEVVEDVKVEEPAAPVDEPIVEEPAEPERVEVIPGYTQDELKESLAQIPKLKKALDTNYGTFGKKLAELDEIIEKHKLKASDSQTEATAKGISLDALKQEYPDIAELLAKDLKGGNGDDVLKVVETKFAEERAQREAEAIEASRKRLARVHPDFREIALYKVEDGIVKFPDPKFGNWLANQPTDKYETVIGSKDADDLSDILTEYKKSLVPEPKKASLEAAILPKGNGLQGRTLTDKEIEDAAFRAAMAD